MARPTEGVTGYSGPWATDTDIPQWEDDILNQLAQADQLSGVDPQILAGIDQAESSGHGGGVNSSGYGGWFGLGSSTDYGSGYVTNQTMIQGTDSQAYAAQAQVAGHEFAKLLNESGGDVNLAEQKYQGGGSEGYTIIDRLLGSSDPHWTPGSSANSTFVGTSGPSSAPQSASLLSYTGTPGSSAGTAGTVLSYLDGFLNPKITAVPGIVNLFTGINPLVSAVATIVDRAVMIVVGVGLIYIGVRVVSGGQGGGPISVIQRQQGLNIAKQNAATGAAKAAAVL